MSTHAMHDTSLGGAVDTRITVITQSRLISSTGSATLTAGIWAQLRWLYAISSTNCHSVYHYGPRNVSPQRVSVKPQFSEHGASETVSLLTWYKKARSELLHYNARLRSVKGWHILGKGQQNISWLRASLVTSGRIGHSRGWYSCTPNWKRSRPKGFNEDPLRRAAPTKAITLYTPRQPVVHSRTLTTYTRWLQAPIGNPQILPQCHFGPAESRDIV